MPDAIAPLADTIAASLDLTTVLALGWLLYLVVLGGWIVLQKREPVATLSWLLALALLPYVGFLIYHVFGPQKIKRHRLRRANSRSQLDASHDAFGGHADARELARLGQAAALLELVLGVQERVGAGFDGHASVDKQLRVLVGHVLVVEGDGVRAVRDRAQVSEVGVVPEPHVAEDLGGGILPRRGEHAGLHP